MPQIFTLKNALLTFENRIVHCEHNPVTEFSKLQEFQIEIGYDLDNKPNKIWIHDSNGMTLLRIQEKPISSWLKGTSEGVKQKVKPRNEGDPQGVTLH